MLSAKQELYVHTLALNALRSVSTQRVAVQLDQTAANPSKTEGATGFARKAFQVDEVARAAKLKLKN
jgi:hypothetical protein